MTLYTVYVEKQRKGNQVLTNIGEIEAGSASEAVSKAPWAMPGREHVVIPVNHQHVVKA